jgi:hypothetical protein
LTSSVPVTVVELATDVVTFISASAAFCSFMSRSITDVMNVAFAWTTSPWFTSNANQSSRHGQIDIMYVPAGTIGTKNGCQFGPSASSMQPLQVVSHASV